MLCFTYCGLEFSLIHPSHMGKHGNPVVFGGKCRPAERNPVVVLFPLTLNDTQRDGVSRILMRTCGSGLDCDRIRALLLIHQIDVIYMNAHRNTEKEKCVGGEVESKRG